MFRQPPPAAVPTIFALCMVVEAETPTRLPKQPRTPKQGAFFLNVSQMEKTNNAATAAATQNAISAEFKTYLNDLNEAWGGNDQEGTATDILNNLAEYARTFRTISGLQLANLIEVLHKASLNSAGRERAAAEDAHDAALNLMAQYIENIRYAPEFNAIILADELQRERLLSEIRRK